MVPVWRWVSETDLERFIISQKLAGLWDSKVEVMEARLEEVDCAEQFDFVTFLCVLHYVTDLMMVMKKLARLCKGTRSIYPFAAGHFDSGPFEFTRPHQARCSDLTFILIFRHTDRSLLRTRKK